MVPDSAVGRKPHLLQVEFLNTRLIGGNGGALHADGVLLDSLSSVKRDLIVGLITVQNTLVPYQQPFTAIIVPTIRTKS